jgi:phage baseplate assembly protein W
MLRKYLYEPITDQNQERIVSEIRQAVLKWEPRVKIERVVNATTVDDIENNTVKLDIYYTINGLNNE